MSKSSVSEEAPPETERKKRLTFELKSDQSESDQLSAEAPAIDDGEVCKAYDNVEVTAERFVEALIDQATEKTKSLVSITSLPKAKQGDNEGTVASTSTRTFTEYYDYLNLWPSIEDFTVKAGFEAIVDYISNWYYDEDWIYDINLILMQSDTCNDYYTYEVKWGLPTKSYPIPQATASVFFTLGVSRVKPPKCQIDVTYQFEGCSYKHVPFKHEFKEKWLFRIVKTKLRFFRSLRF